MTVTVRQRDGRDAALVYPIGSLSLARTRADSARLPALLSALSRPRRRALSAAQIFSYKFRRRRDSDPVS